MKFTHISSPFSTLLSRKTAIKTHLARSRAFLRTSTLRLLSHDARNNYNNSTGSHVPLYSALYALSPSFIAAYDAQQKGLLRHGKILLLSGTLYQ